MRTRPTSLVALACAAALGAGGALAADQVITGGNPAPATALAATVRPVETADNAAPVDWTQVAAKVRPSVVAVDVATAGGGGQGSGVVMDDRGHIMTNAHVVGGGTAFRVTTTSGLVFDQVELVGADPATDIAVLKVPGATDVLAPVPFADSDEAVTGAPVMALGNPLGLSDTVTTGIISAIDRPVITADRSRQAEPAVTNAIQTDAAINPGNSGGALVNADGEVLGINSSIASLPTPAGTAGSIGLGFAIPANEAMRIAAELIEFGRVEHAWLGVSVSDGVVKVDGASAARTGAVLSQVVRQSPAAVAGLQPGDTVISADGDPVTSADSLIARVRELAPGDDVSLDVVREGERVQVQVRVAAKSQQPA